MTKQTLWKRFYSYLYAKKTKSLIGKSTSPFPPPDPTLIEKGNDGWKTSSTELIDLYKYYNEQMNNSISRIWKILFMTVGSMSTVSTAAYQLSTQVLPPPDTIYLNSKLLLQFSLTTIFLPVIGLWVACIGYIFLRGEHIRWLRYVVLENKIEALLGMTKDCKTVVFPKDSSFLSSKYYQIVRATNVLITQVPDPKAYPSSRDFVMKEFKFKPHEDSFARSRRIIYWDLMFIGLWILCIIQVASWTNLLVINNVNNIPLWEQIGLIILIGILCIVPIIITRWSYEKWGEEIDKEEG